MELSLILFNIGLLISLVFGGILGSYLAQVVFGRPKYGWSKIVEIVVYSVVLILSFTLAIPTKITLELLGIYFLIGLFASLLSRGVSTGLGFLAVYVEETTKEKKERTREEKLIINVARILFYYGLSDEDVLNTLVSAGFDRNLVETILSTHHFERGFNPLIKRIVELENEIKRLKESKKGSR